MKRRYRLLAIAILGLALALPLPASAKSEGHGRGHGQGQERGQGHSSGARDGHSYRTRGWEGRGWGGGRVASRTYYRSGDWHSPRYAARSYYRTPDWGGRAYYRYARYDGPRYSPYAYRSYYYVDGFHRPAFYGSGFSLGFVISSAPLYGYRYYDPYCGVSFATLDDYAYHCGRFGHPEALLMIDVRSGYPVATCGYHGGNWVVDDCD